MNEEVKRKGRPKLDNHVKQMVSSARIRYLIDKNVKYQYEFSAAIGCNQKYIDDIICGKKKIISDKCLSSIYEKFGAEPDYITGKDYDNVCPAWKSLPWCRRRDTHKIIKREFYVAFPDHTYKDQQAQFAPNNRSAKTKGRRIYLLEDNEFIYTSQQPILFFEHGPQEESL